MRTLITLLSFLLPTCSIAQIVCDSGAYIYEAVSENGDINSSLSLTLRRNDVRLPDLIGQIPRNVEDVYVVDGAWVMTVYTHEIQVMSFNISNSTHSNFRNDLLIAFSDGQIVYPRFDILGMDINDGRIDLYDFAQEAESPPEQIAFTMGFRALPTLFARLKNRAGEEYSDWSLDFDSLQTGISASTGTWLLQTCLGG